MFVEFFRIDCVQLACNNVSKTLMPFTTSARAFEFSKPCEKNYSLSLSQEKTPKYLKSC